MQFKVEGSTAWIGIGKINENSMCRICVSVDEFRRFMKRIHMGESDVEMQVHEMTIVDV